MKWLGLSVLGALSAILVGCAGPSMSAPGSRELAIPRCFASIAFAGVPRFMTREEVSTLTGGLSLRTDWTADGWAFESPDLTEAVVCACRNRPLAETEVVGMSDALRRATSGRGSSASIPGLGRAYDFTAQVNRPGSPDRARIVHVSREQSCLLLLTVREAPTPEAARFLSRISPIAP